MASKVSRVRRRQGRSQADVAEAAGVSPKTVQRLEAGKAISGRSRRAVLGALGLDPTDFELPPPDSASRSPVETALSDVEALLAVLDEARTIEIVVDRAGWRAQHRRQPWYRGKLIVATRDPIDEILTLVDRITESASRGAGEIARDRGALAEAMAGARAMGWAFRARIDGDRQLRLLIGAPQDRPSG